ncbi:hypothetical protein RZS08_46460, partial [Arthrospira platensis SPKY1]|nr:hypothetical protein [Arthrospira platensis SPKY1]
GTLAQELGIVGDVQTFSDATPRTLLEDRQEVILGRSGKDRAAIDDRVRLGLRADGLPDLLAHRPNGAQAERAVGFARSSHRDEGDLRLRDGPSRIGGRPQLARGDHLGD